MKTTTLVSVMALSLMCLLGCATDQGRVAPIRSTAAVSHLDLPDALVTVSRSIWVVTELPPEFDGLRNLPEDLEAAEGDIIATMAAIEANRRHIVISDDQERQRLLLALFKSPSADPVQSVTIGLYPQQGVGSHTGGFLDGNTDDESLPNYWTLGAHYRAAATAAGGLVLRGAELLTLTRIDEIDEADDSSRGWRLASTEAGNNMAFSSNINPNTSSLDEVHVLAGAQPVTFLFGPFPTDGPASVLVVTTVSIQAGLAQQDASVAGLSKKTICANDDVDEGWIKIDDLWVPMACGNSGTFELNVWVIEKFEDKPIGSTMLVCSSAPVPEGWEVTKKLWRPNLCGRPTSQSNNVMEIKRVE